jgi:hypothetical protein
MALAAMTRNLARLALVGGSLLVGLALLLNISIVMMLRDLPEGPQMTDVTPRALPNPAGAVATLLLLIGVAVAFILVQYRTRLVRAALATGAAGLAAAILFLWAWPWQFQLAPVPPWATSDAAVRLASASTEARFGPLDEHNPWSSTEAWRIGSVQVVAAAIEDGWLATARLDTAVMSFGDGTTLSTAGNGYASPVRSLSFEGAADDGAIQRVLGVRRLLETAPEYLAGTWAPAIILRQADFEKYQGVPGTYRGQFMVDIDRVVVAATLPLQAGAGFQGHHYRLRIDQVGVQGPTAVVRVRLFTSGSMFDEEETPRLTFFLRNRAAAEAVPGSALGDMGLSGGVGLMALGFSGFSAEPQSGFHVTSNVTRFPAGYGVDGRRVELSAEWLSQAELVIVQTVSAGSITRTLEVPGLRMVVAPPTRMPQ